MVEADLKPGDIFRSGNGNLYLVLPNLRQVYLGNTKYHRSDDDAFIFLSPRLDSIVPVEKVTEVDPEKLWPRKGSR